MADWFASQRTSEHSLARNKGLGMRGGRRSYPPPVTPPHAIEHLIGGGGPSQGSCSFYTRR